MTPDDDQEMVFPWTSVMVTMVLLKLAFTWATPEVIFLRSLRLTRTVSGLANFHPSVRYRRCRSSSSYIGRRGGASRALITSSCRRSAWPDPCGYAHWCACAGREPADLGDDAGRGSC